jgi:hypothetical protein
VTAPAAGTTGSPAGQGDDILHGDATEAFGFVRCGADRLVGGKGDDLLYGDLDPGPSIFADVTRARTPSSSGRATGHDTIGDFEVGRDKLLFLGFGEHVVADARAGGAGLRDQTSDGGAGSGDLTLRLGGGDAVTLLGVGGAGTGPISPSP